MSDSSVNDQVIAIYDEVGSDWAASHNQHDFWLKQVKVLHGLLPKGKIIDIGSGGGRDAPLLTEWGYDYIGVEPSKKLLEFAKMAQPKAHFESGNIFSLNQLGLQPFDGFWCAAVLLHIPYGQINEALQQVRAVLKDGAVGFIALKEGKGIITEKDGREFFLWEEPAFTKVLQQNGFEILDFEYAPMSKKTKWLNYFVRLVRP